MDKSGVDNDTRGWIMCIVSGLACVAGASIICVDLIIRYLPGKRNFKIQDSNVFLACSLSLSFGVMLFSALNSMLPSAKQYLKGASYSDQAAGLILMACFIGGFIGIQVISRLVHQYMPSHVVDCDHTHDENAAAEGRSRSLSRRASHLSGRRASHRNHSHTHAHNHVHTATSNGKNGHATESSPLLGDVEGNGRHVASKPQASGGDDGLPLGTAPSATARLGRSRAPTIERRPSMAQVQKRVLSFVKDTKCNCDEMGPCYGYTDPCGQECFKHLGNRSTFPSRPPTTIRTTTGPFYPNINSFSERHGHVHEDDADSDGAPMSPKFRTSRAHSREPIDEEDIEDEATECSSMEEDLEAQHHHHVPTNAFLSLGLQTSIAIALHKLPEGFITYATNHANPALGFNVFLALFVHNISEGFAMALPLYMALGSRMKAMLWSSVLGGLSQPLGAGIAVLWFKLANHTAYSPNAVAYACMFAITAGIMVSVALQLFVESLSLNHDRNLCILFGFLGMALLGLSSAIAATH